MKKLFSAKFIILSSLIFILVFFLGGCVKKDNTKLNIFSRLNGQSITIPPSDQSWGRWISTNIKTEPNIHNQLSYLESFISKKFDLNLTKGQHLPLQLQNGVQYLDPEKDKNEIKLLSDNGETGSFNVTWAYTTDQKQIFQLYHKLKKIPAKQREAIIDYKTIDFDPKNPKPIHPSIAQVRNAIWKVSKITPDQESMIKFSEKSDFNLWFNTFQDIFPQLCLSKNQAKYNFPDYGALGKDMIQPKIKVKWYNLPLMGLVLKYAIVNSDDAWWGGIVGFPFDMNVADYADNQELVYELLRFDIGLQFKSIITKDLYDFFSISHTKLINDDKKHEATLYFNKDNKIKKLDNIVFERTIWIRGVKL